MGRSLVDTFGWCDGDFVSALQTHTDKIRGEMAKLRDMKQSKERFSGPLSSKERFPVPSSSCSTMASQSDVLSPCKPRNVLLLFMGEHSKEQMACTENILTATCSDYASRENVHADYVSSIVCRVD